MGIKLRLYYEWFNLRTGKIKFIIKNESTGFERISYYKNTIVNAGKDAILSHIGGLNVNSNPAEITYGAVGTDSTAIVAGDTTLGTELKRNVTIQVSESSQTLTMRVYYSPGTATGTIREFGWFGEAATGSADSGTLFNRVMLNEVIAGTDSLTVEQDWVM